MPLSTPVRKCFYLATSLSTLSMLTKVFIVKKKILLRWVGAKKVLFQHLFFAMWYAMIHEEKTY